MPIIFDPINKLINITSPTTNVLVQDLYTAAMDWADEKDNLIYDPPMDANGKFALSIDLYSDVIYRLLNGWKLKWFNGNKTVYIEGTLITDDGSSRTIPADSGNVETIFIVRTAGTIEQADVYAATSVIGVVDPTEFSGGSTLSTINNFYNGSIAVFTSGALKGVARKISNYIGITKTLEFNGGSVNAADAAFPIAPSINDRFKIIGRMS